MKIILKQQKMIKNSQDKIVEPFSPPKTKQVQVKKRTLKVF